ncbi:MAG: DUF6712 family protein [Chitinophagaceae bacterium]
MAQLINDIITAKKYVRVNFINSAKSLPDFQYAAERFLIPVIGQTMYDDVLNDIVTAEFPENPPDGYVPIYDDEEFVNRVRAVVCPLAYMLDLATSQVQLTDAGLRTISTDNMQAAHRWEYNEVRESLADKGSFAIESLLQYLFTNKADYPHWTDSDEYKLLNALVFKTGIEFSGYFKLSQPHRTFWTLRPLIAEVQDLYVAPLIGEEYYKTIVGKGDPSIEEKQVLLFIKKAVAQYTILKSIEKLLARQTAAGFTILLTAGNSDSANAGTAVATDNSLDLLYKSCERTGDAYALQLKEYLDKTASAEKLAEYFNSDKYVPPTTQESMSPNHCRKIFGF